MTEDNDLITERVVSTAKRLEDLDADRTIADLEETGDFAPLDIEATVSMRGTVKEITATLAVGGPYIEVDLTNKTVYGSWGSDTHKTHTNADDLLDRLDDYYRRRFEEVVLE